MKIGFRHLSLSLTTLFIATSAFATKSSNTRDCESILGRPLTLAELTAEAQKEQAARRKEIPQRTFVDPLVDQGRVERTGVEGPQALMDLNPPRMEFQGLQAPFAETPAVVKLDSPGKSVALRKRTNFNGKSIATTVYASIPSKIRPSEGNDRGGKFNRPYLIGAEHAKTGAIFWMHGGGTPTATGVNAMSVGLEMAKRNLPVIGPDMPGHGNSDIFPFKSGEEQIEYAAIMMKDLIHPDVTIFPAGHSWGGQFAIQMRQMIRIFKKHGLKVGGFISLSPPADLSLGGTSKERLEADAKVDACYNDWKHTVADSDYEFIENMVRNGKTSPVAGIFCTISQLDYSWKLPDNEEGLPPLLAIVGESDGLVYTGREAIFKPRLIELAGKDNVVIMGRGRTFKGNEIATGHNIFDRYLDAVDREKMAEFLGNEKDKETVAEVYARVAQFIEQRVGNRLAKIVGEDPDSSPADIVDRMYRHYANNLAFRQFVKTYVYRSFRATPESITLRERRLVLERYLKNVKDLREVATRDADSEVAKEIEAAAAKYKVKSLMAARKELPVVRSPERTQDLKNFVEKAIPIRDRIILENPDQSAELIKQIPGRPAGINSLADAELAKKSGGGDKQRRKAIENFLMSAQAITNKHQKDIGRKIGTALDLEIKFPENIKSIGDAQWELSVDDSPERKNAITAYLNEVKSIEDSRHQRVQEKINSAMDSRVRPEPALSFEAAEAELAPIRAIGEGRYIPEGDSEEAQAKAAKAAHIINRLSDTNAAINSAGSQITSLIEQVRDLKLKRINLTKSYEAQTKNVRHPELERLIDAREHALEVYTASNRDYDKFVGSKLSSAYDRGELTTDVVRQLFQEVHPYVQGYNRTRKRFLEASREVDDAILRLAHQGQLGGDLKSTAIALYGEDGRGGIEQQLQSHIGFRDQTIALRANSAAEAMALRKKYNEIVPGYYQLYEQDLAGLLNRPYVDLIRHLSDGVAGSLAMEAMRAALKEFEDMWQGRDTPDKKGAEIN